MASYSEQLAQRKQVAADEEAALVAHFGPEANNYANWDSLWQRGRIEELTNPSPTDIYQPKGLPASGGWVSEDWREAGADPPSLYSNKFLFYFTRQLADDKAELIAMATDLLIDADAMDCDLFTAAIDTMTVYLHSPALHHVAGNGHPLEVGQMTPAQIEDFFQSWNSKKDNAGLFVTWLGVAIANKRVVPAEVAKGKLQEVRRQIEARQQQLRLEATARPAVVSPAPTRQKTTRERRLATLAQGNEPEEVRKMLMNLGMRSTYDKPGEWAAAFRALWVAELLTGNAPAVHRWAIEHVHVEAQMFETFKKPWHNEWNEASQFTNDAQKTVFRTVLAAAQRLLRTKAHK